MTLNPTHSETATAPRTLASVLQTASARLRDAGIASARLDAELLLAEVLGIRREDLLVQSGRAAEEAVVSEFDALLMRRLAREPVAYLLGRREFFGLDFVVTPDVLVPRWETELLLAHLFAWMNRRSSSRAPQFLDVGTGSGILAVCIAKELPEAQVTAVDICPKALALAKENARRHGVSGRIRFVESDLFEKVTGSFDAIVSNPPYLESARIPTLMPDVRDHEPMRALDGGHAGLLVLRRLIAGAASHLIAGGGLFVEIGEDQGRAAISLAAASGTYRDAGIVRDATGCERMLFTVRESDG